MDTQMEKLLAAQERALQQKNEADRKAKQAKKQIEDLKRKRRTQRLIIALPKELTLEQNIALIRRYCQTTFVDNFIMLMAKTPSEQEETKARIRLLQQEQQHSSQSAFDDELWREAIRQYADIAELDAVTLNKLVRQIVVHEEIGDDRTRMIQWRFTSI